MFFFHTLFIVHYNSELYVDYRGASRTCARVSCWSYYSLAVCVRCTFFCVSSACRNEPAPLSLRLPTVRVAPVTFRQRKPEPPMAKRRRNKGFFMGAGGFRSWREQRAGLRSQHHSPSFRRAASVICLFLAAPLPMNTTVGSVLLHGPI